MLQFGSVRDLFKGSYFLSVSFQTLRPQSLAVVLAGKRILKVKNKPRHSGPHRRHHRPRIFKEKDPLGSTFTISPPAGLMGDAFVDIEPPGITDRVHQ